MSLTVYGFGRSRAQRAIWAAEEAGITYDYKVLNPQQGELRQPEYLAINPGGKVPALVHDGLAITESPVICTYIGEQAPDSGLVPGAGRARVLYDQWMFFVATELEQPLWTMTKHTFALPPKLRVPDMLAVAPKEFARAEQVLAQGLGDGPFLLGEQFTMADVMAGHTLFWAKATGVALAAENVAAYAERLRARPAWQRTAKITMGG